MMRPPHAEHHYTISTVRSDTEAPRRRERTQRSVAAWGRRRSDRSLTDLEPRGMNTDISSRACHQTEHRRVPRLLEYAWVPTNPKPESLVLSTLSKPW